MMDDNEKKLLKLEIKEIVEKDLLADIYNKIDEMSSKISDLPTVKDIQFLIDNHQNRCVIRTDYVTKNEFCILAETWWEKRNQKKIDGFNKDVSVIKNIGFIIATLFGIMSTVYVILLKLGILKG